MRTDTVNEEPFLGKIEITSTHSKDNQWMIELLLNGKPVQFKIDTGADVTAISEEDSRSLHGPAKQAPTNNAWTIHSLTCWHINNQTRVKIFCSSIVATRESVSVEKEHSKQYGGQGLVDNYKRWYTIVLYVAENATHIQSFYEHRTTKLTLEEVATDLF